MFFRLAVLLLNDGVTPALISIIRGDWDFHHFVFLMILRIADDFKDMRPINGSSIGALPSGTRGQERRIYAPYLTFIVTVSVMLNIFFMDNIFWFPLPLYLRNLDVFLVL